MVEALEEIQIQHWILVVMKENGEGNIGLVIACVLIDRDICVYISMKL